MNAISYLTLKNNTKMKAIWALAKMAYKTILRPLVLKAIDDPDSEVDDIVMSILDRIFDCDGK